MIRVDGRDDWLLITQQQHARISHELAASWGNLVEPPLIGDPEDSTRPFRTVLDELLEAVLHHDDGWAEWSRYPGIDPEHLRPYDFTEMPYEASQTIWSRSIDVCRSIGPLAGWLVAGHFIALQSKHDEDYSNWSGWLAEQQSRREPWLEEWLSLDGRHSRRIAERCLFLLQTFDWLSLWFCREAIKGAGHSIELSDPDHGFGPYRFRVDDWQPAKAEGLLVSVDPWPFATDNLWLGAESLGVRADAYSNFGQLSRESKRGSESWSLSPRMRVP